MKFIRLLGALVITALSTMAQIGALSPLPIQQPLDNSGHTIPGGCLYTYKAGTTTAQLTYSDAGLTTPNANPIVLDSSGRAPAIYLSSISYKFVLAQKALGVCPGSPGTVIWSQDNVSSVVAFQQVGGVTTTVQAALRNCPFDVQYISLATAIANIPTYGCLNVVGTWTISSLITVPANVTLYGQPGSSIRAGLSSGSLISVVGTGVTFDGIHVDGRFSQGAFHDVIAINGSVDSTYLTVRNSVFTNLASEAIVFLGAHGEFNGNTFTSLGNGSVCGGDCAAITGTNAHYVSVTGNTFDTLTSGNPVHFFSTNIAVVPGDFIRVAQNTAHNLARIGAEFGPFVYQKIDVLNNYFDTWTSAGFCISVAFTPNANIRTLVDGNTCIQPASGVSMESSQDPAIEILADNAIVTNNHVSGSWYTHYVAGGHDMKFVHNFSYGSTQTGISENDSNYHPINNTYEDNTIQEFKLVCISTGGESASGDVIRGNTCDRTPGFFSSDGTGGSGGILTGNFIADASGVAPILVEGNKVIIEQASIPGTYSFWAFNLEGAASNVYNTGTAFRNNMYWNKNATAFGTVYLGTGTHSYQGVREFGNTYINAAVIGNAAFSDIVSKGDNKSTLGLLGSGTAATDYTITDYFDVDPGVLTKPTCLSGVGLDGAGAVSCTAAVTGTPYSGQIVVTASGVPTAASTILTLTEPAGAFTSAPYCTWSSLSSSPTDSRFLFNKLGSTSTSLVWTNTAAGALVAGTTYGFTYYCPKN